MTQKIERSALLSQLMSLHADNVAFEYDPQASRLYAVSIGLGADPTDPGALRYCYEDQPDFCAFPTQICVIANTRLMHRANVDRTRLVIGEQRLKLFRSLAGADRLLANSRVSGVVDKGAGKGSIAYVETDIRRASDDQPLGSLLSSVFLRGNGGIGSFGISAPPTVLPSSPPDASLHVATSPDQALLYRLNGDLNPLHVSPEFAARAGFQRPILHGLGTLGMAIAAIAKDRLGRGEQHRLDPRHPFPPAPGRRQVGKVAVEGGGHGHSP